MEAIATYFRDIRKKYAHYEGSLKGVDSRILISQVPGGMLTNMESQLKEQGAADKFDEVMLEIPRVREDLGFIPLVTPTSQIVGTQAVLNVMNGERYKNITKETAGVLKGEYGATPAPVNKALQDKVLNGAQPITCRPADLLEPEMDKLIAEVREKAQAEGVSLANIEEDALINGLFAQVGWKFLANRGNPAAFEAAPDAQALAAVNAPQASPGNTNAQPQTESYTVNVDGRNFSVIVGANNAALSIQPFITAPNPEVTPGSGSVVESPMSGNILKVLVTVGSVVAEGDVVVIMEAMKMETEVRSKVAGIVSAVYVKEGSAVSGGDVLLSL
jgi:oxaloacetate decarboxylase alpha subunit